MRLRGPAGRSERARFAVAPYAIQLTEHVGRLRPAYDVSNVSSPSRKGDVPCKTAPAKQRRSLMRSRRAH
jgi:hypothetical protein